MSESKRYFLDISYKGTRYHGFQIQKNAFTVQEALENGLSTYFRESISVMGSGRTDTGVHAIMQICHFETNQEIDRAKFIRAINGILPKDIAINSIREVKADAHARFSAKSRAYVYRLILQKSPFIEDYVWRHYFNPDINRMNAGAKILLEYNDFECFSKVNTAVKHFRCEIKSAHWEQKDGELQFHITANRFLRGMVRAIVGTLVSIGLGKIEPEEMHHIIESRDRIKAGKSAPASGLFFSRIEYSEDIYLD
ncbi:tRNA pseudouridine38-40 synthase [Algoriphagus ratkowskyi]|uniref:tRNA pseudouridine synthase A n=1 Tax=Algoriphagus ratkowskyi TaxID=57028 RepID=A0A2W7QXJ8_9BACT|nr:tRNA pseudouridine(38-40) synthase TruA [Algoriphagus ratkowskyi]PZX51836.1 tRNA pseudouridine38-40 synthase [Algoriphagus ratkowskyi]TXD76028.1 tRNA pseudouridine(38-40) synthase TruA [Algoriphagus ratkowskyi]